MADNEIITGVGQSYSYVGKQSLLSLADGTLIMAMTDYDISGHGFWWSGDGGTTWARMPATSDYYNFHPTGTYALNDYTISLAQEPTSGDIYITGRRYNTAVTHVNRGTWDKATHTITWPANDGYEYVYNASSATSCKAFQVAGDTYVPVAIGGTSNGMGLVIFKRTSGGTWSVHQTYLYVSTSDLIKNPRLDVHHNGDGQTIDGDPHIYVYGAGETESKIARFAYSSGPTWTRGTILDVGWQRYWSDMFYDGTRIMVLGASASTPYWYLGEIDEGVTSLTDRSSSMPALSATTPVNRPVALFYDNDRNVYCIAVQNPGAGSASIEMVKWTRSGTSWGSLVDQYSDLQVDTYYLPVTHYPVGYNINMLFRVLDGVGTYDVYNRSLLALRSLSRGGGFGAFGL